MSKNIIKNYDYNFAPAKRSVFRSMSIRKRRFLNYNKSYTAYLSIDGVAEIVDYYVFGKSGKELINVNKAGKTKVLFVNSDLLEKVEFDLFPQLRVIISGNSDRNFYKTPEFPSSVNLVLLQNCSIISDKVKPLPIGLENKRTGRYNADKIFYEKNLSKSSFSPKILVPPMSDTNSLRSIVISQTLKLPKYFDVQTQYLYELEYFSLISKYNFLLCLEGNGFDTHRIWEAMYLGVFPVMFRTKWATALETLKLPILFIEDLSEITENKLSEFWQSNSKFTSAATPQLWLEYWHKLIRTSALDS
jgi:hypothetical protein